jgi:hypothetical protein
MLVEAPSYTTGRRLLKQPDKHKLTYAYLVVSASTIPWGRAWVGEPARWPCKNICVTRGKVAYQQAQTRVAQSGMPNKLASRYR